MFVFMLIILSRKNLLLNWTDNEEKNSYFHNKVVNGIVLRTRCEIADTSEASSATHRVRKTPIYYRVRNKILSTVMS